MTCASCALNNERALAKTKGILNANVNFASKKALVEYDADILGEETVKKIIRDNGYDIEESSKLKVQSSNEIQNQKSKMQIHEGGHIHEDEDVQKNFSDFVWSAVLSAPLLIQMFVRIEVGLIGWVNLALATIVVFYFGCRFHKMAWKQARHFSANMDTLVSMGTLVAYCYSLWAFFNGMMGYFESAALIVTLILLGKYFEARSTGQAGEAMRKLMELGAKKARVIVDGKEREMDVDDINIRDIVLVKPSEKIPLDGVVI